MADSSNVSAFESVKIEPFVLRVTPSSSKSDSLLTVQFIVGDGRDLYSLLDSISFKVMHFVESQSLTPTWYSIFPEFEGLTMDEVIERLDRSIKRDSLLQHYNEIQSRELKFVNIVRSTEYPVSTLYLQDSLSLEN